MYMYLERKLYFLSKSNFSLGFQQWISNTIWSQILSTGFGHSNLFKSPPKLDLSTYSSCGVCKNSIRKGGFNTQEPSTLFLPIKPSRYFSFIFLVFVKPRSLNEISLHEVSLWFYHRHVAVWESHCLKFPLVPSSTAGYTVLSPFCADTSIHVAKNWPIFSWMNMLISLHVQPDKWYCQIRRVQWEAQGNNTYPICETALLACINQSDAIYVKRKEYVLTGCCFVLVGSTM